MKKVTTLSQYRTPDLRICKHASFHYASVFVLHSRLKDMPALSLLLTRV